MRRPLVALAAVAVLVSAGAALAADRYQVRYTAGDQTAARGVALRKADVGAAWSGGRTKPDLSPDDDCASYRPKRSDLLITGAAASEYKHPAGLMARSDVTVLASAAMVRVDWQRSIAHPRLLACLREQFARKMKKDGLRLVSLGRVQFPRVAPRTAAFRMVLQGPAGPRVVLDFVALAKGRTELLLALGGPYASRSEIARAERRLARVLVARARA